MNGVLKGMKEINGYVERKEAIALWNALFENNLTELAKDSFQEDEAEVYFNPNSGYVFLSDDDYTTVMLNDDGKLDLFITTPDQGFEGFFDDIMEEMELNKEDREYMKNMATETLKEKYKEVLEVKE